MKDDHWFSSDGAGGHGQAFNVWLINSTVLSAHYHYLGDERWRQRCEGRDNDERERPPLVEPNDRDFPSPLLPYTQNFLIVFLRLLSSVGLDFTGASGFEISCVGDAEAEHKPPGCACTLSTCST